MTTLLGEAVDAEWSGSTAFQSSPKFDLLASALTVVQGKVEAIDKSKHVNAGKFSYEYAPLDVIIASMRPLLAASQLAVIQLPSVTEPKSVTVQTVLLHSSGQFIAEKLKFPVSDGSDAKAFGSAVTYARRYAYCAMLGIQPQEEDDDGAAAQAEKQGKRRQRPQGDVTDTVTSDSGELTITVVNSDGTKGGQRGRLLQILTEHAIDKKEFGNMLLQKYGYIRGWDDIKRKHYDEIVALAQAPAREPGEDG
jgi:hypothetical protein